MLSVPKARFTHHGLVRVLGSKDEARRLTISPEEVVKILDDDKAVPVGRDPKDSNKIHRAFYSKPDDECFVAVQDSINGEVVTVLPFSHHGRFAIDPIHVRKLAMELMGIVHKKEPKIRLGISRENICAKKDARYVVSLLILRPGNSRYAAVQVLRHPVPEGTMLYELSRDKDFQKEIEIESAVQMRHYCEGTELVGYRLHFLAKRSPSEYLWLEKDFSLPKPNEDTPHS